MRRKILVALLFLAAIPAFAQIHYFPPSVTAMGPHGRLAPVPFPSVTSMGPLGFRGNPFLPPNQQFLLRHRHFGRRSFAYPMTAPIYTPYAYPSFYYFGYGDYSAVDSDMAPAYAPYAYPMVYPGYPVMVSSNEAAMASALASRAPQAAAEPAPAPPAASPTSSAAPKQSASTEEKARPQEPTVLVFRDGHRLTVYNYAIVGSDLYNLSGGGPRKIQLASLDLDKTIQINDESGVGFRLPGRGGN